MLKAISFYSADPQVAAETDYWQNREMFSALGG